MPESVPTVADLTHVGLAHRDTNVPKGGVARFHVSQEGHDRMGAAMRRNALEHLEQEGTV